jgi:hypothetical protein
MFTTSRFFRPRVDHAPRRGITITAAALVSVLAGSSAAASAQPAAHPGIGHAFAGAGPVCESRGAQPLNLGLASLNLPGGPAALGCGAGTAGPPPGRGELAPEPGRAAITEGDFCTSAASCWAVGYFERNGAWLNEALRWNGHRWFRVAAPNPGGTASGDTSELYGVRCTASKDCWAVGFYERHGVALDEALHWNGKSWSLVATPTPAGTLSGDFNELIDVACTSPDSCWADGEYGTSTVNSEISENQALHWNGTTWSLVSTPNPGGTASEGISALSAIRCASAGNCWAVGTYGSAAPGGALFNEVLHWNGRKWSQADVPNPSGNALGAFNVLEGLACTSGANCWATGSDGYQDSSAATLNQALHWNGHEWIEVSTPQPDGILAYASNVLVGVSCSSPDSCWAVGYTGNLEVAPPVLNEALHWNGSHWSAASVPQPGGRDDYDHSLLYGVRCTSRTNCWASGQAQPSGKSYRNELVHWNGTRWSAA